MTLENSDNITSLFLKAANQHPDNVAIIEGVNNITYGQLEMQVKNYAAYLLKKGIKPGDRILVFVPMGINLYKTVLAVFHIGAVAVFLDEWVSLKRLELCCRIAKCKAFIAPWKIRTLSILSKELRAIPIKLNVTGRGDISNISLYASKPNDSALITFTTGSTGNPKAANRTNQFLLAQYNALQPLLPENSKVDMTMLPIVLLLNLGTGKTSVVTKFNPRKPEKFQAGSVYAQLKENGVQSLTFSPYYLLEISKYLLKNELNLPELKSIISGGGPIFPDEAKIIAKAFKDVKCDIVYGSTESEPIAHTDILNFLNISNEIKADEGLFVGKIDISASVKIIPIKDSEVNTIESLPLRHVGEIIVSGSHVLTSYFNSEDAFRLNKIKSENTIWHRTGDAGWLNEKNELFLMGRCKQIIHWENRNLYPFLVEQYLKSIPGILMGTLIEYENVPVLVIQLESGEMKESILNEINKGAYAEFKKYFLLNIPMDKRHNSKIDYDGLLHAMKKNK